MEDNAVFTLKPRFYHLSLFFFIIVIFLLPCRSQNTLSSCEKGKCMQGDCVNGTCVCNLGWGGSACDHCSGRVRLTKESSYITDGFGNYSENNKCTWLIDPGNKYTNSTIRLRFNQFSTECGWDHLYIYDGDSVYSKLLAAYSGLIQQNLMTGSDIEEITAKSGKVYLYFYSDAAYNMSGFNISYRIDGCANDCNNHGTCLEDLQTCACNSSWTGIACETALCPNNCSGKGSCKNGKCLCNEQHRGIDCSVPATKSVWSKLDIDDISIGRASAAAIIIADDIYISGGYAFDSKLNFLSKFHIPTETWNILEPSKSIIPADRYGHSLALFQNKLYMFGGVVDNNVIRELWIYDIKLNEWSPKHYNDSSVPIAVAGHVAHVVNSVMYVLFGHSPIFGYKNRIQEYHILNDTWYVPKTKGAIVQGGYGHASAYDPETQLIYVCGGYYSGSTSNYKLTDALYSFSPSNRSWTVLRNNVRPRYLHSAVVMNGLLLIFAGNTHNDTSISQGAKCYSPDLLAYDIKCNKWYEIHSSLFPVNGERYGHIAVSYTRNGMSSMYLVGGFNGIMLNNILKFTPGNCTYYINEKECTESKQGDRCVWAVNISRCMSEQDAKRMNLLARDEICNPSEGAEQICKQIKSCSDCLSTVYGCAWCKNNCTHKCSLQDMSKSTSAVVVDQCRDTEPCTSQHNCHMCQQYEECWWRDRHCNFINLHDDSGSVQITQKTKCAKPCYLYKSCENCTQNSCMWCSNKHRCVETNSYVASFIYGQCMEWTTSKDKCPATRCSDLHRCDQCQTNPACGWCNDPSNTGIGRCIEGGDKGPIFPTNSSLIDSRKCPAERWFFTQCPVCQCNGHSTCTNQTGVCDGCKHMTEGSYCEVCQEGYYGTPVNGGNCSACECNGQADTCDRSTGSCNCRTRGVIGTKCDRCDEAHKYFGNPKNGGTCYYDLVSDYQFTFNLSKRDDKFYTQINFMNIPSANDRDVDFKVNCSGSASLNISVKTKSQKEENIIVKNYPCTYFRAKFEHRDYSFGPTENTTFLVYVYGFQTPFWLQISFSQFPKIDLVHFFVTFFSCFLSLLIIAAVLYKIKHKYDNYRRRQRMIVEMEEMASRPFSSVTVEIDKRIENSIAEKKDNISTDIRRRKKIHNKPSQVALEPLHGQKAAVLTLLVQLPTADDEWTPNCSSGLAIASALVTLGHPRKQSVEHIKGDKNKFKKHTFPSNLDTCA